MREVPEDGRLTKHEYVEAVRAIVADELKKQARREKKAHKEQVVKAEALQRATAILAAEDTAERARIADLATRVDAATDPLQKAELSSQLTVARLRRLHLKGRR